MYLLEQFLKNIYGERFSGEFDSNEKGSGYDLEDFKEYSFGDNVKKINWKMLAKYDKEYVSVYKVEKDPVLDIFIDNYTNFFFFKDILEKSFGVIDLLIKNLGIKVNIYCFEKNKIKKIDNFNQSFNFKNNKSNINEILNSDYFLQDSYKLVLSDFIFLDNDLKNLKLYKNKIFLLLLPLKKLLQKGSFPTLNGYFDRNFNKDLLNEYKFSLEKLTSLALLEEIS